MLQYIKHKYYHTCPLCGSNLDLNEWCDCENETSNNTTNKVDNYKNVQGGEEKDVKFIKQKLCSTV